MLFNSITFLVFFIIFFIIYWIVSKRIGMRNLIILLASYIFYAWWDWRFLSLIIFSTVLDFYLGQKIYKEKISIRKRFYLICSLIANIGLLGYFKYFNFFIDSFVDFIELFGMRSNLSSLNIILPVGISFYTFQTLSYTIDVFRGEFKPTKNIIEFAAFVSFFPQLVAGPIERARNLLPQFTKYRKFSFANAKVGLSQIIWGFFKKIVIADNCAIFVDQIFGNYGELSSFYLILGSVLFAFQIYCDFSGYSDIAIGMSRLLGFDLMTNFKYPYFSRDIAEFWRRWHISLSTWFRDYLYIPLVGSRVGFSRKIGNTFAIFLVSGMWHGANWTFLIWGALNAIYFIPLLIQGKNRNYLDVIGSEDLKNTFKEIPLVFLTFLMTCFAWIFFRSESVSDAWLYIGAIFTEHHSETLIRIPNYLFYMIGFLVVIDFLNRKKEYVFFNSHLAQWSFL